MAALIDDEHLELHVNHARKFNVQGIMQPSIGDKIEDSTVVDENGVIVKVER